MKKIKLGVIFGGMSSENEVSLTSGLNVLKNLDKEKYDIYPIYIGYTGKWYKYNDDFHTPKTIKDIKNIEIIDNLESYLKSLDKIFPVLHGMYGEDGTIQGLFEMIKVPYVGCGVLASSVGMDKVYSKIIFKNAGFNQARYCYIKKYNNTYKFIDDEFNEKVCNLEEIANITVKQLRFPLFVKPSNSGSSVGINKATNIEELKEYIDEAANYDKKILIEEGLNVKEVECAVLGNEENVISACVGEILSAEEFYSFDAKYKMEDSKTIIPANITEDESREVKRLAEKAFKCIDGKGLSRVDFFIEKNTGKIYINEINTMPGFTEISMFPKLFEQSGVSYSKLLDKLIELA